MRDDNPSCTPRMPAVRTSVSTRRRKAGGWLSLEMSNSSSASGAPPNLSPTRAWSKRVARRRRVQTAAEATASSASTYLRTTAHKEPTMNKYALLAQKFWKTHAPQRYQTLENPEEYFATLGETAAAQIARISAEMERDVPHDLEYLDRVGQLRAIQKQAEEIVLNDLVYSVETEAESLDEELEEMLGDLPSPQMIEDSLRRIQDEAEQAAEQNDQTEPILTEDQAARKEQLTALLPLVTLERDPDQMSEAELRDRILALKQYWDPQSRSLAQLP